MAGDRAAWKCPANEMDRCEGNTWTDRHFNCLHRDVAREAVQFDEWESRIRRMESDFQFLAGSAAQLELGLESTELDAIPMEKGVGGASKALLDRLTRLESLIQGVSLARGLDSPPAPAVQEEEEEEIKEAAAEKPLIGFPCTPCASPSLSRWSCS
jgi:hypothetical protein